MLSLLALLVGLLVFTKLIQPSYGADPHPGPRRSSVLPLALAAVAQAVIVISRRHRPVDRLDDGAHQRRRPRR